MTEQYTNITAKQAYEWVKTGHWNLRTFSSWLEETIDSAHSKGHAAGYDSGWDEAKDLYTEVEFDK